MYGQGISKEGSLLDMAVTYEIVSKSGAWYTYEGERLRSGPRGREGVPRLQPPTSWTRSTTRSALPAASSSVTSAWARS